MKQLKGYYFVQVKNGDKGLGYQGQIMDVLDNGSCLVDIFSWIMGEHSYSMLMEQGFFWNCRLFKDNEHFKEYCREYQAANGG